MRQFPIDEVITCATGRMVAKRNIEAIFDLLNYISGRKWHRFLLPDVAEEYTPYLMAACPQMEHLDFAKLDRLLGKFEGEDRSIACQLWLKNECQRLGLPNWVDVSPIPKDDHDVIDPLDELRTIRPDAKIIVASLDEPCE